MSSHYYEVALFGEFYAKDLKAILNRTALHSESAGQMHTREVVLEPLDAPQLRATGQEPVLLRARKELLEKGSGWILHSYLKPESVRTQPDATVRPWATVEVIGDALSYASALGYVQRSQRYKRGYVFRRGPLVVQIFQQEQADPVSGRPIPARPDTLWEVEVRNATPARNTPEAPLSRTVDAVLEVQLLMKGLLDLRRQDG